MATIWPLHEVTNEAHKNQLRDNIAQNGWQGVPLVIYGEQLVTGSHRYAACKELGWDDDDIPTITLEELYAEAGMDIEETCAEVCSIYNTIQSDAVALAVELPNDIATKYGIDCG